MTLKKDIADLLTRWDKELPQSVIDKNNQFKQRRDFLQQMLAVTTMSILPGISISSAKTAEIKPQPVPATIKDPWLTISGVQQHLFPATKGLSGSSGSPGAKEINALGYLQTMFKAEAFDTDEKAFLINGVNWLNDIAKKLYQKTFVSLGNTEKETVLRSISKSTAGENWISSLMLYLLEALLTDPVYGGNPNGIGWKWLQHQAGFPQPPADKKYWLLK